MLHQIPLIAHLIVFVGAHSPTRSSSSSSRVVEKASPEPQEDKKAEPDNITVEPIKVADENQDQSKSAKETKERKFFKFF